MKSNATFYVLVIFTIFLIKPIYAQDESMGVELKKIMSEHLAALEKENLNAAMSWYHSKSPAYPIMSQMAQKFFNDYDMMMELIGFKFIGMDGQYAIAGVRVKTKKISGPMFQDNINYNVYVFKKERVKWKIWTYLTIETTPI